MQLDRHQTIDIRDAHIENISITERVDTITDKNGTTVRYKTLFYDSWIKLKEINLPMLSNDSLEHIKTKKELLKIL